MERFILFLSGLKMTIISGVALLVSLGIKIAVHDMGFDPTWTPAWITILISGIPLLYYAVTCLFLQKRITSSLLITTAMIACICTGQRFAAGEVAFIMAIGELLEAYTVSRAKRGITKLIALAPDTGRRIVKMGESEREEVVPIEEIKKGDILRVLPGERITVDGEVVYGTTSVDQSIMTGESLPVDKGIGDMVFCGTMNCYGSIDIRATRVGSDSSLQKMIDLVKEAETKKAPMQRTVDKWASWLVPISLCIAIITYFATGVLDRAVTVLVVFCPCALALATPVAIVAGIGQATKFGVLIKSGEALERMGKVSTITFDKTGTLTKGTLAVCNVKSFLSDIGDDEILRLTASAESRSEHPIAKAIVARMKENSGGSDGSAAPLSKSKTPMGMGIHALSAPENFAMVPGKGIAAEVDGKWLLCGKSDYLKESGIEINNEVESTLERLQSEGKAYVLTAIDGKCAGVLALSDEIRSTAKEMVSELNDMNVEVLVLTGDSREAASYFASQVGIQNIRAELLPEQKVSLIEEMQGEGKSVCMIGDGVNDAPALKTADVGVAMGGMGSDIAIDSADIALMADDISKLPYLKRLSNAVIRSIHTNISISMTINLIAITLSILGLLTPVTGALVHNAGSVLVVLNAALLYDRKI